jgi:uncharacterized membrane protein
MWERSYIKERAKQVLKNKYWKAFIVSLVIALAGGGYSNINGFDIISHKNIDSYINKQVLTIIFILLVFLMLLRVFIGYLLEVGGRKFFIEAAEGKTVNIGCLGYYFKENRYINVLLTMLLTHVYIFLWTLLFIIPGVEKSYAYRFVPYILADNPYIEKNRAMEISNEMTMNHKLDIFVLDLSFVGWYLLGTLALFVGVLFVYPYEAATNAELYLILRQDIIKREIVSSSEFNIDMSRVEQEKFE